MSHPLRIAHRGMPLRTRENTLAGFALALEAGADGIELDVHTSADGAVVVHHDPFLADGSPIALLTLGELQLRAALPTLEEVCRLVAGRAELFVELKGEGVERAVADALAGYDGPLALHSFDHATIRRLAASGTGYRLGVLFEQNPDDVGELMASTGALDVWPQFSLVTEGLVTHVHSLGGRVLTWTVNSPDEARRVSAAGVDGICTDDVRMLEA